LKKWCHSFDKIKREKYAEIRFGQSNSLSQEPAGRNRTLSAERRIHPAAPHAIRPLAG
jgi:hypothetical protein